MVVFPNCKINLGLRVTDKRTDGFHNLDTVFLPLSLKDALELNTCSQNEAPFTLSVHGEAIPGSQQDNLCTKAWQMLHDDFPDIAPVDMQLLKGIPIGAGLGGGSSDGAFALKLLNDTLQLALSEQQLLQYALQLGSDCPFFIANSPCHATGRGELLKPIDLKLDDYYFILVYPGIHVNTGWAFAQLSAFAGEGHSTSTTAEVVSQPLSLWKEKLVNDFEAPVFQAHPVLHDIKEKLYNAGAEFAAMTGTGSTIYGIFNKRKRAKIAMPAAYQVFHLNQCL